MEEVTVKNYQKLAMRTCLPSAKNWEYCYCLIASEIGEAFGKWGKKFRDGSFDAAWCNDSFHHYPDPERAAFQAWRVLAPGGTLVVGDAWQPAPARAVMNAWMSHSKEGDVRIYSEAELRRILGTWFSDVSWRRVGQTACVAVARKGR